METSTVGTARTAMTDDRSASVGGGDIEENNGAATPRAAAVQPEDLPVDGEQHNATMVVIPPETNKNRKWWIIGMVVVVVVLLGAVIGLAVGLTNANKDNNNNGGADESTSTGGGEGEESSPPVNQAKLDEIKQWIVDNQYSSASSLEDPNSPQSKAASFMEAGVLDVPTTETPSAEMIQWMERYVLAVFYHATSGDSAWKFPFSFMDQGLDICQWFVVVQLSATSALPFGASCAQEGRVQSIIFVDNNLDGSLPSELGLLTEVTVVILSANPGLTGGIPEEVRSWNKLGVFEVVGCSITGKIPAWIGEEWTELGVLALTGNQFTGTLPTSMGGMTKLLDLLLDENNFTGDLKVMEDLSTLIFFYAEENGFVQTIDDTFLSGLTKLRHLDISDNSFNGKVPVHLMSHLEVLDVHDNDLTEFPDSIPVNTTLEFLAVHNNSFTGAFPRSTIVNLKELEHLDLSSTSFTGAMPTVLGNLTKLRYLFLADTVFEPGPIPDDYQRLLALQDLSLKDSRRTGVIPSWIDDLDRLVLLDLHSNDLTGSIPTEIGRMGSLQILLLNENNLTGTISPDLSQALTLQLVLFNNNNVTGSMEPICEEAQFLNLAAADCGTNDLNCTCCELCCGGDSEEPSCSDDDWLAQYDPQWRDDYERRGQYLFLDLNITRRLLPGLRL